MSIQGKKQNKGEWAEFYVLLKLLGEGRLYTANNLLQKNLGMYLDVLKIIRQELESRVLEYIVDKENNTVRIEVQGSSKVLRANAPCSEFIDNASKLFNNIKSLKGNSVSAPEEVCRFAEFIYIEKPKAPAVRNLEKQFGGKNDIFIEVRDSQTAIVSVMGFSIKSKFGSNPTLFNAGPSSQFLYKLAGCNEELMDEFNAISEVVKGKQTRGWGKCKQFLIDNEIVLEYAKTQNPIYASNLLLVRDNMDKILAWCVKDRLIDAPDRFEVKETTERLIKANPLRVPNPSIYYEKAVKDFLMDGFTGMTAGRAWDGKEQVNGGYIVVTDDGDVVCYHSNDREAFRSYLYRNTYFEYVSTKKYHWGDILKIDSEYYLSLNTSIRFSKHTR